ncbi:DDE_3 domain-containing protein [Trichonephila clavipes]|nr:DDE_3 domain-containing protein [Trichonephila clavipes]
MTVRLLNVPRQIVSDAICRFKELGNDGRCPESGRKRTESTSKNPKVIEKLAWRNPRLSMRQIARDIGISDRSRWERFLFTDEKLFTVQQAHNSLNDRIWSVDATSTLAIVGHRQYPKSVMVWGRICARGKTSLVFVEEGVKINEKVYQRDIIEAAVLPWDQKQFGN